VSDVLFFGCRDQPGHSLWGPGWASVSRHSAWGLGWDLDGDYAPRRSRDGRLVFTAPYSDVGVKQRVRFDTVECPQGQYLLHVLGEPGHPCWTVASWWDRCQGDERGGCSSTVLLEGVHSFEEVLQSLLEHFPSVLANLARRGVELCPAPVEVG
jgi:hypothetical protein